MELALVALRRPTDKKRHPVHDEIKAPVFYLPEYLHEEPGRVLERLARAASPRAGFWRALGAFAADLPREFTRNRFRRFGQALVLAANGRKAARWLHAHFIHTPASVARYASLMLGIPWTCSAHAKDIWTSADWELAEKLDGGALDGDLHGSPASSICARSRRGRGNVHLSYHGLDLARFGPFAGERSDRDGSDPAAPVTVLSVGRAVEKKGYDMLLKALALLPADLNWRFDHIGGGELLAKLRALADELGHRRSRRPGRAGWRRTTCLRTTGRPTSSRWPAASRRTATATACPTCWSRRRARAWSASRPTISGVPELLDDGENGLVVPPEDPAALAAALERRCATRHCGSGSARPPSKRCARVSTTTAASAN